MNLDDFPFDEMIDDDTTIEKVTAKVFRWVAERYAEPNFIADLVRKILNCYLELGYFDDRNVHNILSAVKQERGNNSMPSKSSCIKIQWIMEDDQKNGYIDGIVFYCLKSCWVADSINNRWITTINSINNQTICYKKK